MSGAAWDEGYEWLAVFTPFLGAGAAALLVRSFTGSERPRIEWKPGDDPPGR